MKALLTASTLALALAFTGCTKEPTAENNTGTYSSESVVAPTTPMDPANTNNAGNTGAMHDGTTHQSTANAPAGNATTGASRPGTEAVDPNATNRNSEMNKAKEATTPVSPGSENPAR